MCLIFLLLLAVNSCTNKGEETINSDETIGWNKFQGKGIPTSNESYDKLTFLNESIGYLGGEETVITGRTEKKVNFVQKAVLYKTVDQGNSWSKVNVDQEGNITEVFPFKDSLIILNQSLYNEPNILLTTNNGSDWIELVKLTNKQYVRAISFSNSNEGYFITDDKKTIQVYRLNVDTRDIDTLFTLPNNHYKITIGKRSIYSLMPDKNADSKGVLITNIETGIIEEVEFDKPYYVESMALDENQELFLALDYENAESKVISIINGKIAEYNLGVLSDYSLGKTFVHKDWIMIIANQRENMSMPGVTHKLIMTKDKGKTWTVNELPDPLYTKPGFLFENNFFMTYCGNGIFQKMNSK